MKHYYKRNSLMAFLPSLIVALMAGVVSAQSTDSWDVPRTADGHADLQGVWSNNTLTPVERPEVFGDKQILTEEDMVFLQRRISEIQAEDGDALFGDGVLAAAFSGEVKSYDPTTGNYDQSWLAERSVHNRTSQIIDPPNGKFPPRTEEAVAMGNLARERRQDHPADSWLDRPLSERCVSYGAPYLGSGYNSYWQIVQSRDHVVIVQEMIHDVRVIPVVEMPHADESIKLWHGESRGYWDGDTLVIETTNYSDKSGFGPETSAKVNIERISRLDETTLRYEITSNDPGSYTAPYTREILFDYSPEPIFEYACHEGNYGMMNILSGHRAEERFAREEAAAVN